MIPLEWAFFKNYYAVVHYLDMAMSREQLQYSKHNISEESPCDSTDTALGKRPYQDNNEPSDTTITDDGAASKKQKIYFDSEEQGPAIESQSTTSMTVKLGKHLLPSDDKGPDIK